MEGEPCKAAMPSAPSHPILLKPSCRSKERRRGACSNAAKNWAPSLPTLFDDKPRDSILRAGIALSAERATAPSSPMELFVRFKDRFCKFAASFKAPRATAPASPRVLLASCRSRDSKAGDPSRLDARASVPRSLTWLSVRSRCKACRVGILVTDASAWAPAAVIRLLLKHSDNPRSACASFRRSSAATPASLTWLFVRSSVRLSRLGTSMIGATAWTPASPHSHAASFSLRFFNDCAPLSAASSCKPARVNDEGSTVRDCTPPCFKTSIHGPALWSPTRQTTFRIARMAWSRRPKSDGCGAFSIVNMYSHTLPGRSNLAGSDLWASMFMMTILVFCSRNFCVSRRRALSAASFSFCSSAALSAAFFCEK
mmetsp:Transcript_4765/g.8621  ORF Transcript_4765/g.8621 Transcript_4765/m.8621 type:complete len:370 (-) Transcript_4765:487-1596(-)